LPTLNGWIIKVFISVKSYIGSLLGELSFISDSREF